MNYHSILLDQARYATYIVAKYLDTATINTSKHFYNNTLRYNMIFAKAGASTSDEQVEKMTREFNIQYRVFIGSLVYLLSTSVYLIFFQYTSL